MGAGTVIVRNPGNSPLGTESNKHSQITYKTLPYLVELFYPTDQVRVTGGVFKEYIICNKATHTNQFTYIRSL